MEESNQEKKITCALCFGKCTKDSPVLVMGPYGNPRLLCEECSTDLDTMTADKNTAAVRAAMERLGKKLAVKNPDDLSLQTINEIIASSAERARLIDSGEYDFSLDEAGSEDELLDIPEDQRESEEDKLLDEKEEAQREKLDKILNWVFIGAIIGVVGFAVYKLIEGFLI